eukprot:CAMPEP_0176145622 /NCGR_PEP_ID=MMETSP0120_2-20121206/74184_1 /TAXON_ID=160619 /ORGANISM="Kryptoperidinium foliaceum, Strain CCMP 1326" /LENGTH=45 /DNA_ID= /DNA_START= /DNA_END= /DNA_ORIENTATION=
MARSMRIIKVQLPDRSAVLELDAIALSAHLRQVLRKESAITDAVL